MKDNQPPWTDNVRPTQVNVNALRIVHATLPVRCEECNGSGQIPSGRVGRPRCCQACNGRGSR